MEDEKGNPITYWGGKKEEPSMEQKDKRPLLPPKSRTSSSNLISDLQEQITILTEQRNGFREELRTLKELYDKSQEENKTLKRNAEVWYGKHERIKERFSKLEEENKILREGYKTALDYIENSPCDPDHNPSQIRAWNKLQELKKGINL